MDQYFALCKCCIEELLNAPLSKTSSTFKELCSATANVIDSTFSNIKNIFGNDYEDNLIKSTLIFLFIQVISSLELFARIISCECKIDLFLMDCRKSSINRIKVCLDNITYTFNSHTLLTNDSGCFLRMMDSALDENVKIDLDNGKESSMQQFRTSRSMFEDVLEYSMIIAQICLNEDSIAIKGSSQAVLESLEELKNELFKKTEPNKAMINLFVDSSGDKLCSVERRVDMAILRLSLHIFSEYLLPLEKIFEFCNKHNNGFDQQILDDLVADFDLHVDRIIQIGLFAVYSSSNIRSGIKIRNCMANLEFLEPELVPSAIILLSDDSESNKTSALIFKNYWIDAASELKKLIFEIIDPSAFCQVINEKISTEVESILETCKTEKKYSKSVYAEIINVGQVLIDFTRIALTHKDVTNDTVLKENLDKCYRIIEEIKKAFEVLPDNSTDTNERLLKRSRVFKAQIKKLLCDLKDGRELEEEQNESENSKVAVQNDFVGNKLFNSIHERARNVLLNRSILYRNPDKSWVFWDSNDNYKKSGKQRAEGPMMQRLTPFKLKLSFEITNEDEPLELHVTEILDNLSHLQTTF